MVISFQWGGKSLFQTSSKMVVGFLPLAKAYVDESPSIPELKFYGIYVWIHMQQSGLPLWRKNLWRLMPPNDLVASLNISGIPSRRITK